MTTMLDQKARAAEAYERRRSNSIQSAQIILDGICTPVLLRITTALTHKESAGVIAPRLITVLCNEQRLARWTGATIRHIRCADARLAMRRFEAENLIMWCERMKEVAREHGVTTPNDSDTVLVNEHCEAVTNLLTDNKDGQPCYVGLMGLSFFTRLQRWLEVANRVLPPGSITSSVLIEAVADEMLAGYNTAPNTIAVTGALRAGELLSVVFGLSDRRPTAMGYGIPTTT